MAHKLQKNNVIRTIARLEIKHAIDLQKTTRELLAKYKPPASASATKIQASAQKIVSVNSGVMQDRCIQTTTRQTHKQLKNSVANIY